MHYVLYAIVRKWIGYIKRYGDYSAVQDASRDINNLYYMCWAYAIVRKWIGYIRRCGDCKYSAVQYKILQET